MHRFRAAEKVNRSKKSDQLLQQETTDGESSSNAKRKRTTSASATTCKKKPKKQTAKTKSATTSGQDEFGDVKTPSDREAWDEFQRGQMSESDELLRSTQVVEIDSDGMTVSDGGWKSDFDD